MASISTRIAALVLAGFTITAVPALAQGRNGGGARNGGSRGGGGENRSGGDNRGSGGGGERRAGGENRGGENRGGDNRGGENHGGGNGGSYQNRSYVAPRGGAATRGAVVVPRSVAPAYRSYGRPPYGSRSYAYRPYYGYRSYAYRPYPYRPYGWRPGLGLNFYFGVPYAGGYPSYLYGPDAAYGYYAVVPGRSYGAVRIVDAPENAQVYVDGSYAGVVDDYDGVFQHLNLEAGAHHIEVVVEGAEPFAFDVNVAPGQTLTYHARF